MRGRQNQAMGLGKFVRDRRVGMGLSLRQAAAAWNLTKGGLSRIESNHRRNPGGETLLKLARGLKCTTDELLAAADFDGVDQEEPQRRDGDGRTSGTTTVTTS